MKKMKILLAAAALCVAGTAGAQTLKMTNQVVRINAYEASTSVNLVVVKPEQKLDVLDPTAFAVETNGVSRNVKIVYTCDDRGEWTDGGAYLAFGLEISSERGASPLVYKGMNQWSKAYPVKVSLKKGKTIKAGGKKYTAVECATDHALTNFLSESDFFARGVFTGPSTGRPGMETLHYGAYEPQALVNDGKKNPLVIWLHGAGEGGNDVSIALMGNEVVSLIREDIQSHFTTEGGAKGAYVLAVQCPTMWMSNNVGQYNMGTYPTIYCNVLKECIDYYVLQHPDVDPNRVYIGGCSNGGYMTMNMLLRNPRYFAAAYPCCEAYYDNCISDDQIKQLAEENIWFVHSFDDTTVKPAATSIATYKRLMQVGAKNVWYSLFENIQGTDFPGQKYYGHFSWVYIFNNQVTASQEQSTADVKPTNNGGGTVAPQGFNNLFDWMNAQVLKMPEAPAKK